MHACVHCVIFLFMRETRSSLSVYDRMLLP